MMGKETKFMKGITYLGGHIVIGSDKYPNPLEFTPVELAHLPDGAIDGSPSFAIILTREGGEVTIVGQFSLKTLRIAMQDVGYDIVELPDNYDEE